MSILSNINIRPLSSWLTSKLSFGAIAKDQPLLTVAVRGGQLRLAIVDQQRVGIWAATFHEDQQRVGVAFEPPLVREQSAAAAPFSRALSRSTRRVSSGTSARKSPIMERWA